MIWVWRAVLIGWALFTLLGIAVIVIGSRGDEDSYVH